jgi:myo-inositol-1(or 4)-monophosphatase
MSDIIAKKLDLARSIAVEAGNLAVKMRNEKDSTFAQRKSHQDFVTAADLAVEQLIRDRITDQFPEDSILGEEQGASEISDSIWVVDPIDGTTNYMHGLTEWAVSIAYCHADKVVCGVIYAPDISSLISASTGGGATLNDKPVHVSNCSTLENALVLLGRSARHGAKDYLQNIQNVLDKGMEYRRNGSAAYSLLSVAAGRAEGYYEAHLNSWDALAGLLIVSEAGGMTNTYCFKDFLSEGGCIIASNSRLHDIIKKISIV